MYEGDGGCGRNEVYYSWAAVDLGGRKLCFRVKREGSELRECSRTGVVSGKTLSWERERLVVFTEHPIIILLYGSISCGIFINFFLEISGT
jgi:hypothetical protein